MERFNLTAEEHLLVELIFISIEGQDIDPVVSYYNLPIEKTGLRQVLLSLQEKGVILKSCKIPEGKALKDFDFVAFNENFLKVYRKSSGELGEELFRAYPNEAIIQGQVVPLRNYAKRYKDETDFYFNYGKSIGWSLVKHQHILDLIQWSKDNDHFGLNMNIGDWVASKMWISIEDHKDGSNTITFDTLTSI